MDVQAMMEQAKLMQEKMQEMQEALGDVEVEGMSENGEVRVRITCKGEVRRVFLRDEAVTSEGKTALEDAITAAMNDAKSRADTKLAEATQRMMGDLGLGASQG